MFWSICVVSFIIVAVVVSLNYKKKEKNDDFRSGELFEGLNKQQNKNIVIIIWVIAILMIPTTFLRSIKAGHVGVVSQFGAIIGEKTEGLQFKSPLQSIMVVNVQTQKIKYEKLSCFSKETQEVIVSGVINFYIEKKDIQRLYREIGSDYVEKLINPRVSQACKNQTVLYRAVDIAPNREKIRKSVREVLMQDPILAENSIIISDFLLENIDFQPEFKAMIEAKQVSSQEALNAKEIVKIEAAKADQKIEEGRGEAQKNLVLKKAEADAILYTAQKQAEANRLVSETLTDSILELKRIEKITDKLKIIVVPQGSLNFLDLKGLMGDLTPQ